MTTAGRPTWNAAKGGYDERINRKIQSRQYSSRDMKSHSKLKIRQPGQGTQEEIRQRDLKRELLARETKTSSNEQLESGEVTAEPELLEAPHIKEEFDERDLDEDQENEEEELKPKRKEKEKWGEKTKDIDADDSDSDSSSNESEEENEEDETAELLKELEKIKKEREMEAKRKEAERTAIEQQEQERRILTSNPLLSGGQDFTVKKRWYDDTVFKNQAKGEAKAQKRFINDTVRNDFHRKFLHKYIQ